MVMYGNNGTQVDKDLGAMRATVGTYILARLTGLSAHLVYSFASYHHRTQQRLWVVLGFIPLLLFIPLFLEDLSFRSKIAVAFVAIIFEEAAWNFCYSPYAKRLLKVKYSTAMDIPHQIDRFAAFFIIVLGDFLLHTVLGSPAVIGFSVGLLRAIWTLIIAFCLNWMYVDGNGALEHIHPIRYSSWHATAWVGLHLPLFASFLAGGHAASSAADYHEEYHHEKLWLLCGGLGTGMIVLFLLSSLGSCTDAPGTLLLPVVRSTHSMNLVFLLTLHRARD